MTVSSTAKGDGGAGDKVSVRGNPRLFDQGGQIVLVLAAGTPHGSQLLHVHVLDNSCMVECVKHASIATVNYLHVYIIRAIFQNPRCKF